MNCPFCGGQMESGYLNGVNYYTNNDLRWRGENEQIPSFEKFMGITGRDILIKSKSTNHWTRRFEIKADYCSKCEKIIFDGKVAKYL